MDLWTGAISCSGTIFCMYKRLGQAGLEGFSRSHLSPSHFQFGQCHGKSISTLRAEVMRSGAEN